MPELESALAAAYRPGAYGAGDGSGVTLREIVGLDIVQVAAWPDTAEAVAAALAERLGGAVPGVGASTVAGEARVLHTGPDRWWVVAAMGGPTAGLADAFAADAAAVTRLGHSRTVVRIGGPKARATLAKGLPVDLHPRAFGPGGVAQSAIHHIGVLVHRIDEGDTFDLFVFRGFGLSFWKWLTDAAAEYGYTVAERG